MPSPPLMRRAFRCLGLLATIATPVTSQAAPFMIVGDDEKLAMDAQGKTTVNPAGNDEVVIIDLAKPEAPKIAAALKLDNTIAGPPTNLAISPNGGIALVANSMSVAEENN